MFSGIHDWNSTSAYDSSLKWLLTDLGIIPSILFIYLLVSSIQFSKYRFRPCSDILKNYRYSFLVYYIVASSTNEFLVLKGMNPIFVTSLALVSSLAYSESIKHKASSSQSGVLE